jgi:DNA-binding NarL/FixJ family response regulator
MSQFNTKITEAIEALDAEIADVEKELEQLKATRSNLETVLVEDEAEAPKKSQRSKVSQIKVSDKAPTRATRGDSRRQHIIDMLNDGKKVSAIAEELGVTTNYVYTIRKSEGATQNDTAATSRSERTRRSSRNSNGGNGKTTKRDRIKSMLRDDWTVKEIAEELEISPSYVYNVKNS